jgi:hypothetical protein
MTGTPATGGPEAGSAGLPEVQTGLPVAGEGGGDHAGGVVRVPDADPAPTTAPTPLPEAKPAAPGDRPATEGSRPTETGIDWERRSGPRMPQVPPPPRALREPLPRGSLFPEAEREIPLRPGTEPGPQTTPRQADRAPVRRAGPDQSLRELFWGED